MNTNNTKPAFCIIAAGKGSRMGTLTAQINKALLPIGGKAAISYIIDKIPLDMEIIVAVGYKKQSLQEYCLAAHPERNFTFVEALPFEGPGAGAGTGLLACKQYLQRPFYFCCNDCIVEEDLPDLTQNWLGVYPTHTPEVFSTVKMDDDHNVLAFMNKSPDGYPWAFIGLAGILDYEFFWETLENAKMEKERELVTAFYHTNTYPSPFRGQIFTWHDTGAEDSYLATCEALGQKKNMEFLN
jgi:NDP-sugar pyrophosphorylase family protein